VLQKTEHRVVEHDQIHVEDPDAIAVGSKAGLAPNLAELPDRPPPGIALAVIETYRECRRLGPYDSPTEALLVDVPQVRGELVEVGERVEWT
jgi:hypothetical protein